MSSGELFAGLSIGQAVKVKKCSVRYLAVEMRTSRREF